MTGLFDGMAGALNGLFGAPVIWRDAGGVERTVQAVFRHEFVEVSDGDGGPVAMARPVLRVPRDIAGTMGRSCDVSPGNGLWYRILRRLPHENPATDAFSIFLLEEVS